MWWDPWLWYLFCGYVILCIKTILQTELTIVNFKLIRSDFPSGLEKANYYVLNCLVELGDCEQFLTRNRQENGALYPQSLATLSWVSTRKYGRASWTKGRLCRPATWTIAGRNSEALLTWACTADLTKVRDDKFVASLILYIFNHLHHSSEP